MKRVFIISSAFCLAIINFPEALNSFPLDDLDTFGGNDKTSLDVSLHSNNQERLNNYGSPAQFGGSVHEFDVTEMMLAGEEGGTSSLMLGEQHSNNYRVENNYQTDHETAGDNYHGGVQFGSDGFDDMNSGGPFIDSDHSFQ